MNPWVKPIAAILALTLTGLGIGYLLPLALDREPPREDIEGYTDKPAYRPGETFGGGWKVTYRRDCPGHAARAMTSATSPKLVAYLASQEVRPKVIDIPPLPSRVSVPFAAFQVPNLPVGKAYYHLTVRFQCNWLQAAFPDLLSIEVSYPVVPFEVLP